MLFALIDVRQHRLLTAQRNLVLRADAAKQYANAELLHNDHLVH